MRWASEAGAGNFTHMSEFPTCAFFIKFARGIDVLNMFCNGGSCSVKQLSDCLDCDPNSFVFYMYVDAIFTCLFGEDKEVYGAITN